MQLTPGDQPQRQRQSLLILVIAGLLAGAVLIGFAVSGAGGKDSQPTPATGNPFLEIPQRGIYAGDVDAPVTLVEFADMQCPFCGEFATGVLPGVVRELVATGKLRLEFQTLTFVGEDSQRAARAVAGAARQNKLWSFVHAFYERQGEENSGYVTDGFLREVAQASDVSFKKIAAAQGDPTIADYAEDAARLARTHGINSTPSFLIRRGDRANRFEADSTNAAKFLDELKRELEE